MQDHARLLADALRSLRNPQAAEVVRGYLKTSSLDFYGIKLPVIRKLAKEHSLRIPTEDAAAFLQGLWGFRVFDVRRAAVDALLHFIKQGLPTSRALLFIDSWIDDTDTWALTDPLSWCVGKILIKSPETRRILREWGKSQNVWRRRMAVLPYLELLQHGQYRSEYAVWTLEAVAPHLGDSQFFVGKAVGWVLRQLSIHEPELVRRFLMENQPRMMSLVLRQSSRKLRGQRASGMNGVSTATDNVQ
jgi:3-methyladenine DNA glycosylase AlkD